MCLGNLLSRQFYCSVRVNVAFDSPTENNTADRGDSTTNSEVIHDTLQQIDLVHRLIKSFPKSLTIVSSSEEILTNYRAGRPAISSLMGVEGLHQIGNSASILRMYYQLGVRYASLTHTCHNRYADSEAPSMARHHGLSAAGRDLIVEMNRLGMMIDLSHTSVSTQRQVFSHSHAPVVYSHSSAYQLCRHMRNVPDDLLWALKANGGIVMVTFYPDYTNCQDPVDATLSQVAAHIQYIGDLIGYEHVGIGSDFDGMPNGPRGLEDVSKYPDLIDELLDRGLAVENVAAVMGWNIVRVLRQVEEVAAQMKAATPLEDDINPFFEVLSQ